MNKLSKAKKIFIYSTAAALIILIIGFVILWRINSTYSSLLPAMPDLSSLSVPLQQQITDADKKAHRYPSSTNIGNLGMVYHSSTYYNEAKECYKLAIRKNKDNWVWKYYLGYLSLEMGETEVAIANFKEIVKDNPKIFEAWYYIGRGYQNIGAYNEAERVFSQISNSKSVQNEDNKTSRNNLFPLQTYAQFQQARIYSDTKKFDKAEQLLKEIIKYNLYFGPAYRLLGSVYTAKGDSTWSKYYIVRAQDLADYTPPVDTLVDQLSNLSMSELYLLKQIDESEKSFNSEWTLLLLKNALTNISNNQYLISKAVRLYLRLNNGNLALPLISQHLNYYKSDINELKDVAGLLSSKGFYSQSYTYYNQLKTLKPDDAGVISGMASSLFELGKKPEALSLMTDFMDKHISDISALTDGIQFLIETEEIEKAKSYLTALKKLSPTNPKTYKFTGMLAETDGNNALAISSYELACKGDPNDVTTNQYYGNMLVSQQLWDKAFKHFRKSLEAHPNEPYLLERIGTLLVSCPNPQFRDYQGAREYSERAFINVASTSETVISAGRSLAMSYAALGDKQRAINYLNITVYIAKKENFSNEYLQDLESLYQHPSFKN